MRSWAARDAELGPGAAAVLLEPYGSEEYVLNIPKKRPQDLLGVEPSDVGYMSQNG